MTWHSGTSDFLLVLKNIYSVCPVVKRNQRSRLKDSESERDGVRVGTDWLSSTVVWGSYLVLKYALMVAGDPFITGRKQKGVSLLI